MLGPVILHCGISHSLQTMACFKEYDMRMGSYYDTKQPAFSVVNLDTFLHNSTPEKFGRIWRIERDEIKAIKFKII